MRQGPDNRKGKDMTIYTIIFSFIILCYSFSSIQAVENESEDDTATHQEVVAEENEENNKSKEE